MILTLLLACTPDRPAVPTPAPSPAPLVAVGTSEPAQFKYCRPWGLPNAKLPDDPPDPSQEWTLGQIENGDLGCYVALCDKDGELYTFRSGYAVCNENTVIDKWFGLQVQAQFERLPAERVCISEGECTNVAARVGVARLRRVGDTDWLPSD